MRLGASFFVKIFSIGRENGIGGVGILVAEKRLKTFMTSVGILLPHVD